MSTHRIQNCDHLRKELIFLLSSGSTAANSQARGRTRPLQSRRPRQWKNITLTTRVDAHGERTKNKKHNTKLASSAAGREALIDAATSNHSSLAPSPFTFFKSRRSSASYRLSL